MQIDSVSTDTNDATVTQFNLEATRWFALRGRNILGRHHHRRKTTRRRRRRA
jgi:hypothetical protein